MKKLFLVALTTMLVGSLIFGGCAKPAPAPAPAPSPTPAPAPAPVPAPPAPAPVPSPKPIPKPEGELRVAVAHLGGETLDPILSVTSTKPYLLPLYDYVVGITWDGEELSTETGIAYKWEASPDKTAWTFYLRKGIRFHNGDEVTAEDVKFTIERVVGPKAVGTQTSEFRKIVDYVKVVGPYEVKVYLKGPSFLFPYLVSQMTSCEGMVVPKRYIEEKGMEYFNSHPIGSGAYKLVEHMSGTHIKYEAVGYEHWLYGVPKYKYIKFMMVPEESTRMGLLKKGDIDITIISHDAVAEVKAAGFNIVATADDIEPGVYIYNWRPGPFNDKRVRQALTLAIDRQKILDTLMDGMGRLTAVFTAYSVGIGVPRPEKLGVPPYDPGEARRLLAEAGYPKGFTVNFYYVVRGELPEGLSIATAIAGYWKAVGIDTKIITMETGAWLKEVGAKTLKDPAVAGPIGVPNQLLAHAVHMVLYHSSGVRANFMDPRLDRLLEDVLANLRDERAYEEAMARWIKAMKEEATGIPLFSTSIVWATQPGIEKDWHPLRRSGSDFNWRYLYARR